MEELPQLPDDVRESQAKRRQEDIAAHVKHVQELIEYIQSPQCAEDIERLKTDEEFKANLVKELRKQDAEDLSHIDKRIQLFREGVAFFQERLYGNQSGFQVDNSPASPPSTPAAE